jgi:DNA-binding LytR/AlgR family response regulator
MDRDGKIRVLIAEDEKPAREELKYLLSRNGLMRVIGEAENGRQAVDRCAALAPDLVFMDIEMPVMNGIEAAEIIVGQGKKTRIVFVTAYNEYAIKAFELRAVDYLLKPVTAQRLSETISRFSGDAAGGGDKAAFMELLKEMKNQRVGGRGKITLYKDGSLIPLDLEEIVYIAVEGRNAFLITRGGRFETNYTLTEIACQLHARNFFQCHRSFIINMDYIDRIDYWFNNTFLVTMKGFKEKIPVSRSHVKEFREILNIR